MKVNMSKKKIVLFSVILAAAVFLIIISAIKAVNTKKNNEEYDYVIDFMYDIYEIEADINDVKKDMISQDNENKYRYSFKCKEKYYGNFTAVYINDEDISQESFDGTKLDISEDLLKKISDYFCESSNPKKPVIYLYPEEETDINVRLYLDENTRLTYTYPEYNEETGWNVTATPDSVLTDANGYEYSYLFWEGVTSQDWDMSSGFVVKGEDTVEFFREKLSYLGLTPKEYNDFIVFWMPHMQDNMYNLITFRTDEYTDMARLEVTPEPESVQRVFMTFKALDEYQEVDEQILEPFERHGYTLIEWGGMEMK